ncbi:MAG: dTMP kinase [Treponema sp.]|nr:dTMP kinase [Treponema sp.]MCL2250940.1 dTMP kinase [Treponema sp.]
MEIISNFIVFEGGDGSGTTTQLSLLGERFKKIKEPFFYPTFEPTGGQIGKIIRSALKKEITVKPDTLAMLFASDRNEHLNGENGIRAQINKGAFVASDRYVLSSLVYQGIECGDELPVFLNSRFPAPEITLFFDLSPQIAVERMNRRYKNAGSSHEMFEDLDFQVKVREKYHSLIEIYRSKGARVEIIDAEKKPAEVADQVWSIVSQMPIINTKLNADK